MERTAFGFCRSQLRLPFSNTILRREADVQSFDLRSLKPFIVGARVNSQATHAGLVSRKRQEDSVFTLIHGLTNEFQVMPAAQRFLRFHFVRVTILIAPNRSSAMFVID
jgi:hypothetical protein